MNTYKQSRTSLVWAILFAVAMLPLAGNASAKKEEGKEKSGSHSKAVKSKSKTYKFSEAPEAVQKGIKKYAKGAKVAFVTIKKEDGKNVYESKFKGKAGMMEVNVDEKGNMLELETAIELSDAPRKVRKAIEKYAGKGEIKEVELKETPKGKFYEAEIVKGKKEFEILVDKSGKIIEEEEEEEGEHEDDDEGDDDDDGDHDDDDDDDDK